LIVFAFDFVITIPLFQSFCHSFCLLYCLDHHQIFSHSSIWHLAFNGFALWSFGPTLENSYFAREQYLAFFLSAGVFASLSSTVAQVRIWLFGHHVCF
jgi:hypothetical protein